MPLRRDYFSGRGTLSLCPPPSVNVPALVTLRANFVIDPDNGRSSPRGAEYRTRNLSVNNYSIEIYIILIRLRATIDIHSIQKRKTIVFQYFSIFVQFIYTLNILTMEEDQAWLRFSIINF